jgi:hypothetical protein
MSQDIVIRPSQVEPFEIVDGELIDSVLEHRLCGQFHPVWDGEVECCCGDTHSVEGYVCCGCGHHHDMGSACLPAGPCGSFLCCIN